MPYLNPNSNAAHAALFLVLLALACAVYLSGRRRSRGQWNAFDATLVATIALVGALATLFLLTAPHLILPEEDAVILFQYSRNLAHTGAITYIPNGPHAEGATDFAWMLLLAAGIKLHIAPFWTVALANTVSILALPFLLARIAAVALTPIAAAFIMGAFALMPQVTAAALGFSVLPFACFLTLVALSFLRANDVALALLCLALCLFRPDGIVFAAPILTAALIVYPNRTRRAAIIAAAFVLPGLLYFAWRAYYFHSLLPLPFLVKSDAVRVAHLFVLDSVQHGLFLCLFAFTLAFLATRNTKLDAPHRALLLTLLILPNLFYFAMRLDQDAGHRFFIYLPIDAAIVLAMQWQRLKPQRSYLLRTGLALWLFLIANMSLHALQLGRYAQFDNRKAIAEDLAQLPHGTLLTTEAGFLPWYSGWPTYDAWGLNTADFAHHLLQPSAIATLHPDAILLYTASTIECTRTAAWPTPYTQRTWQHLTRNMVTGIDPQDYTLWYVPYGNAALRRANDTKPWQGDQECWFLRNASPLATSIAEVLTRHHAEPADIYQINQPHELATITPSPDHPTPLRILARTPYRWWTTLTD
jgi:hypothetical protein